MLVEQLPTLFGTEKNGKTKVWSASIHNDDNKAWATIEFGQINGKKQITTREYTAGKNIGKKNETSFLQQCLLETKKKWQDKIDKEQYSINQFPQTNPQITKHFPMLAQTYNPNKKSKIIYPCYVQPKLDGLRCITYFHNNSILYQSRQGIFFNSLDHLTYDLLPIFKKHPSLILDGELYTQDFPFEELAGIIKKKKSLLPHDLDKIKLVKYHIYDIIHQTHTFHDRYFDFIYKEIPDTTNILKVPTSLCNNLLDFKTHFNNYVHNGFEGIILRNINGLYTANYRSHDLQKYKEFQENEYEIIDFKEGEGRDHGTVLWVCKTNDNKTFNVRPRGSIAQRKEWFQNGHIYIGKMLTVIFQELSESGIPRFPVGKDIREHY